MHPKTLPSFWSDLDFERYQGQELTNARAAFHWTFGGPITNSAGIFPFSNQFTHQTGLPLAWLHRLMEEFPRAFLYDPASRHALLRHYIRHQFNTGDKLVKNNMCPNIVHSLRAGPLVLGLEVLRLYPELALARDRHGRSLVSPTEALAKGLPSPTQALACSGAQNTSATPPNPSENQSFNSPLSHVEQSQRPSPTQALGKGSMEPPAQETEKETATATALGGVGGRGAMSSGEGRGANAPEVLIPSLAEVVAWGDRTGVDRETCEAFFAYHESRGWMSGATQLRKPLSLLAGYAAERRKWKKPADSKRLDASAADADALRAQLQTEKRPAHRAALEKRLATL